MSNHQQYPNHPPFEGGPQPQQSKIYVTAVSIYGHFPMQILNIREAVEFVQRRAGEVICILGAMRRDGSGRELLELADLERWIAENESGAEWKAITDGELFAAETGALR